MSTPTPPKLTADQSRIVTPPCVVIAGAFGASAFAVAVLSATWANRPMADALADAVLVLVACYPLGYVIGRIATVAVDERVESFRRERPLQDEDDAVLAAPANDFASVEDLSTAGVAT